MEVDGGMDVDKSGTVTQDESSSVQQLASVGCDETRSRLRESGDDHRQYKSVEYEAQHFGFTPITLLNGMFNAVCDLYREALKAFSKTCLEKYPDVMSEEELREARHKVSELIDQDIAMNFDKLESFLLNSVFVIPEHAVLPEDKSQLERLSGEEETQMDRRKNEVKRQIIAVKYANAVLSQQLDDGEALQAKLGELLEKLESNDTSTSPHAAKELKDWLSYYGEVLKSRLTSKK